MGTIYLYPGIGAKGEERWLAPVLRNPSRAPDRRGSRCPHRTACPKRRIHKKPADAEIEACYQWLEREIELVAPQLIVALGATAARSLLGRATPVERNRGKLMDFPGGTRLLITVHPSMLLRIPDEYKAAAYRRFVKDLKLASPYVDGGK